MRIACFGKVTRDEMMYLAEPVIAGGNAHITEVETVYGGMATWAGRAIMNAGHTPVLFGCTGTQAPYQHLGPNTEDYLVRQGNLYHIRVLISPDGQRSFLAPTQDTYPTYRIPEAPLTGLSAVVVDGYSLLPHRNAAEATELVLAATAQNPGIPVAVTLPVVQKLGHGNAAHLADVLATWGPVIVSGGWDEHAAMPDSPNPLWTSVITTGSDVPHIVIKRGTAVVHTQPVTLTANPRNTNGAGDTFLAGAMMALAAGTSIETAILHGHQAASAHVTAVAAPSIAVAAYA